MGAPHGLGRGRNVEMTLQRQMMFWLGALAATILVLWLLSPILLPFIAGLALAYFLDPVADRLERLGLPRLAATLVILLVSLLAVVLAALIIVPVLSDQIGKFAGDLPEILRNLALRINELAPAWLKEMLAKSETNIQGSLTDFASKAAGWILTLLSSLLTGGMALVNIVSLMVVTPIVAFYLLVDWDHIVAKVDGWLPRDHAPAIRQLFAEIDRAMAGFIRGQGTLCLAMACFYATGLSLAGLKFGLAIGIVTGLVSFIPYAGAAIGGLLAIGVALFQFWPDFLSIALVVLIFAAGQFIEGNILSPKLVGRSVGLHPVWLMFALFAFGYIFGFVGLLLAVPMAAAAGVLSRFALRQYLGSKLYLGTRAPIDAPTPLPSDTPGHRRRRGR
ncbi:MAG: AI-2E family transporter [Alphaproteobacteria bacterium]|nr:AI-2E family transporter [Alphaproteobacteria bacterium]